MYVSASYNALNFSPAATYQAKTYLVEHFVIQNSKNPGQVAHVWSPHSYDKYIAPAQERCEVQRCKFATIRPRRGVNSMPNNKHNLRKRNDDLNEFIRV